jgi:hypothetical protein
MFVFDTSTAVTADSSVNTALNLVVTSVAGQSHYLYGFGMSTSGISTSSSINIIIKDGVTSIYKTSLDPGSPVGASQFRCFPTPIKITAENALTLTIDAGGASVVTIGNLVYTTR